MKKKIIFIFIGLLILGWYMSLTAMISAPRKYEEHMNKAADYEQRGIYIDAVSEYEEILVTNPKDIDVMMRMANDYLYMGEEKKFVSTLKNAIEICSDASGEAMNVLMNYYIDNNKEAKAIKYIIELTDKGLDEEYVVEWMNKLKGGYKELYAHYDEMLGMYNDSMVVRIGEYYSIVDASGNRMLELEYLQITPFSYDGFARTVDSDNKTIYINKSGQTKVVPEDVYSDLGVLNSSRIVAKLGDKYGYLDENGVQVTDFIWEGLTSFNKVGLAKKNGKWAIVDLKGKEKTDYVYDDVIVDEYGIACNQHRIFVKNGNKYYLIDSKGKEKSKEGFDDARIFPEEGYAAVCIDNKWGYINADGQMVIECTYDDALSFSNGYAAVCQDGKWGYIDEKGHIIITPMFIEATSFSKEGTTAVLMSDEEGKSHEWKLIRLNIYRYN